jgi:predicted nuclease with TOPRIM domain
MSEQLIVHLRRLEEKLDRVLASLEDVEQVLGSIESKMSLLHYDFGSMIDRVEALERRVDQIERRLGVAE